MRAQKGAHGLCARKSAPLIVNVARMTVARQLSLLEHRELPRKKPQLRPLPTDLSVYTRRDALLYEECRNRGAEASS